MDKTFRNVGQGGHWDWEEGMRIRGIWYMHLKTENICLKICVEIHVDEKICENTCNVI